MTILADNMGGTTYLIFSYYSTPEFVMVTEKLCRPDTILIDDISDTLKDLIQTSHQWFLEEGREREREKEKEKERERERIMLQHTHSIQYSALEFQTVTVP